jgi:hypothetical protein
VVALASPLPGRTRAEGEAQTLMGTTPNRPGAAFIGRRSRADPACKNNGSGSHREGDRAETRANTEEGQAAGSFSEVSQSDEGETAMTDQSGPPLAG